MKTFCKILYTMWISMMIIAVIGFGILISFWTESIPGFIVGVFISYIMAGIIALIHFNKKGGEET